MRDGVEQRLVTGMFGIFGHGNVCGIGQALLQDQIAFEESGARIRWMGTMCPTT